MVRQFKLGGVYKCEVRIKDEEIGASFLIKVVGFDRIMLPWDTCSTASLEDIVLWKRK